MFDFGENKFYNCSSVILDFLKFVKNFIKKEMLSNKSKKNFFAIFSRHFFITMVNVPSSFANVSTWKEIFLARNS